MNHPESIAPRAIPVKTIYLGRVGWFLGVVLLVFGAWVLMRAEIRLPRCAFLVYTGFPCALCGSTRALSHLAEFHLIEALQFNPLAVLFCLSPLACLFPNAARVQIFLGRFGWWILIGALLLNWIYLVLYLPR